VEPRRIFGLPSGNLTYLTYLAIEHGHRNSSIPMNHRGDINGRYEGNMCILYI
jgi:hypothetical protein